jgi:hypothetical protein
LVISEDDNPAKTVAITVRTTGVEEKMESLTPLGLASLSVVFVSFIAVSIPALEPGGLYALALPDEILSHFNPTGSSVPHMKLQIDMATSRASSAATFPDITTF